MYRVDANWDELFGIEKVLVASVIESGDISIITQQLIEILLKIVELKSCPTPQTESCITTRDVLLLCLYCYSLVGDSLPWNDYLEARLKESFFKAMLAV